MQSLLWLPARSRGTGRRIPSCAIDRRGPNIWIIPTGAEETLKRFQVLLFLAGAAQAYAPAFAGELFPASGNVKLAAYAVCRSLGGVDMGPVGAQTSAECNGIVKTRDGSKLLDNLAIRCLEESRTRANGYRFFGTCIQTDSDGDKLYMAYEGPESGPLEWLGGTGKYEKVTGSGTWTVADAPGNNAQLFAFTLTYDVGWTTRRDQ